MNCIKVSLASFCFPILCPSFLSSLLVHSKLKLFLSFFLVLGNLDSGLLWRGNAGHGQGYGYVIEMNIITFWSRSGAKRCNIAATRSAILFEILSPHTHTFKVCTKMKQFP